MPIIAMSNLLSGLSNWITNFNVQDFLILILVLCISLSIHEVAHGWVANKLGDDTAYLAGRLTLNPLAHLDLVGSLVFIFSYITLGRGFGWAKPVPINPTRFDQKYTMKKGIVLTSLAGPGSNIILAIISNIIFFILLTVFTVAKVDSSNVLADIFLQLFNMLYLSNYILAIFNLLPIPPLDGFKIFGALLPDRLYYKLMSYERYIGMVFLFVILFGRNILSTVLDVVSIPFDFVIFNPLESLFRYIWQSLGLV